jgi:hypothetical protein
MLKTSSGKATSGPSYELPEGHFQFGHKDRIRRAEDLCVIFKACFYQNFLTSLEGNAPEPLYEPARCANTNNVIYYRDDYFSSALHEVAHWCIAGVERRKQTDYGYWYSPDGRSVQQQSAFEQSEIKPQAIEWAFSIACNVPFRVSSDNINAQHDDIHALAQREESFKRLVYSQLAHYVREGFPSRAQIFLSQLHKFYNTRVLATSDLRFTIDSRISN